MASQAELDLVFGFYQGLARLLPTVVPFKKSAAGTVDIEGWLDDIDARVDVHQVRLYVQAHAIKLEVLCAVLKRLIAKERNSTPDKNKTDLLLVQYLAQAISTDSLDLSLARSAIILEPVLGAVAPKPVTEVDAILEELQLCSNLHDLVNAKILERAQQVKLVQHDYTAASLVTFTHCGLLLRRGCARLLVSDLQGIETGLKQLDRLGVRFLDCRSLGLSETEPVENLQRKVREWRKPFPGKYQDHSWFQQIAVLQGVTQSALLLAQPSLEMAKAASAGANPELANEPQQQESGTGSEEVKTAEPEQVNAAEPKQVEATEQQQVEATEPQEEKTTEPKAAEASEPGPALAVKAALEVEDYLAEIVAGLQALRSGGVARVQVGKAHILLSSDEIRAFRSPNEPAAEMLKTIAAVRALVADAVESSDCARLTKAKQRAAAELELIRQAIAEAQQAKKIELAINLTASARALEKAVAKLP